MTHAGKKRKVTVSNRNEQFNYYICPQYIDTGMNQELANK